MWTVWERWATAQRASGKAASTIQSRKGAFRMWWEWVDGDPWSASHNDVEAWIASRNIGPAASCRAIGDLAVLYRWALREGLVGVNPCDLVDRPKRPEGLPRPVSGSMVTQALTHPERRPGVINAVALMAYGGLRCIEVAKFDVTRDVDMDSNALYVQGKGGRTRWVPIIHPLRPYLYGLDGAKPGTPIIPRANDPSRSISAAGVSQQVSNHLRAATKRQATAHQLRHFYGSQILERTGNLELVQLALGHVSIATSQIYARLPGSALGRLPDVW